MKTSTCHTLPRTAWMVVIATVLAACSTAPTAHKNPVLSEWPDADASRQTPTASRTAAMDLPPAVIPASAPIADAAPIATDKPLPSQTISDLDLAGVTDVATVLRAMAKAAGVNILISPNVSGDVSFTFQNVPWDQAFRSVIASAGLTYMWEGDVLRVMTIEDIKRELEIESVRKERENVKAELRQVEPLVMQVYPIKYARAKGLGDILRVLLAAQVGEVREALVAPRAFVTVDEESNAIIIHAIREDLQKAQALIGALDQPKAQVHIEARIVEATRDTARQLGVQWGGQYTTLEGKRMMTVGGPGVTAGGFASDFPAQFAQDITPPIGFTLGFISEKFGGAELLNLQLTALQRSGQIHILSSPSITTLDNEKAVIESGEERAYRVTTGTGNILDVSLEWKKAVLKLEVTPHVVDDEFLRVEIIANKDSFDETRPQTNNEFPVNTKHARTTVLLRNGQTVVIGGLSLESKSDTRTGIPYLMNIPVAGHLFKNTGKAAKFDDTLIFITPRVIRSGV